MSLALFKKTSVNHDSDNPDTSKLCSDGTYIFFASEGLPTYGGSVKTQRIYMRRVKISDQTLLEADISGNDAAGWSHPDMVLLDDGTLIAGYQRGTVYGGLGTGFQIKECANATAGSPTWGSAYTGSADDGTNHTFHGIFTDGTNVFAVTQDLQARGGRLVVHTRTAANTWRRLQLWINTSNPGLDYWDFSFSPQQNGLVSGSRATLIGWKSNSQTGGLESLTGYVTFDLWLTASLITPFIVSYPGTPQGVHRIPILARSPLDGIVRLVHTHSMSNVGPGLAPKTGYAVALGGNWVMNLDDAHAFLGTDGDGNPITWPSEAHNVVSLALDGKGRQLLVMPDYGEQPNWLTFGAFGTRSQNWQLLESVKIPETLTGPDGTLYANGNDSSPLPAPSIMVGQDLYRILNAWNEFTDPSNGYAEQWLCKSAGIGKKAGGGTGGGGKLPHSYSDA